MKHMLTINEARVELRVEELKNEKVNYGKLDRRSSLGFLIHYLVGLLEMPTLLPHISVIIETS
jgi:hypothetical protein